MKWLTVTLALALACDSTPPPITCYGIPPNGCPDQGSATCTDPTCAAVYECQADGGWALAYSCPPPEGGAPDADAGSDAPVIRDSGWDIDAPPGAFGGPGCIDLQQPDCPLGTVLICNAQCCGCESLFVCADGGWDFWGVCTDAGPVPQ